MEERQQGFAPDQGDTGLSEARGKGAEGQGTGVQKLCG